MKKKLIKKFVFLALLNFSQYKNWYLTIFEITKMEFWQKNFFGEIDLFDFTSFFAWTFLNFLARYAMVDLHW